MCKKFIILHCASKEKRNENHDILNWKRFKLVTDQRSSTALHFQCLSSTTGLALDMTLNIKSFLNEQQKQQSR